MSFPTKLITFLLCSFIAATQAAQIAAGMVTP